MIETVDFSAEHMPKEEYKPAYDKAVDELVLLQQRAVRANVPIVLLFDGFEDAGKGSRINELITNLDSRATHVHVTGDPVGYDARLPFMARFWSRLPKRGHMAVFDKSWYHAAVIEMYRLAQQRAAERKDKGKKDKKSEKASRDELDGIAALSDELPVKDPQILRDARNYLTSISAFERQITDDGYVLVKFFVTISREEQRKRMKHLLDDPATAWRVDRLDRMQQKNYEWFSVAVDALLEATNRSYSRWHVLNGEDRRATRLAIVQTVVDALAPAVEAAERRIAEKEAAAAAKAEADAEAAPAASDAAASAAEDYLPDPDDDGAQDLEALSQGVEVGGATADALTSRFPLVKVPTLAEVRHDLAIDDDDEYDKALDDVQKRLGELHQRIYLAKVPVMVAYEGWDAAGKGGNIKRLAQALDARGYEIYPSPAPTPEELAHPHLWRYWTRLPRTGHIGIYDRTWYGRVLVERVEGLATVAEWQRAYDELNEFEEDMRRAGVVLVKFWVDVSPEVQLQRFREREETPEKRWKITPDDWRNREKNPLYYVAVNDMLRLTSTEYAPWHIIESDDKHYARIKALNIVADAMEKRLREVEG
jgi:polyphosphate kinase 2 (PPK2 family)